MERIRSDDPQVPSAPLRGFLLRAAQRETVKGLEARYARRFDVSTRHAARLIAEVLRSETVSVFLADTMAILIGLHLDNIYEEGVA